MDNKEILAYSRKIVFSLIRGTYRSACQHPFVVGILFFLLTLYILLPRVLGFLISSSPTIICTLLLLGTLLSFGHHNVPELEEDGRTGHQLSSLQIRSASNDLLDSDRRFSITSQMRNKENAKGASINDVQGDDTCKVAKGMFFSTSNEKEERRDEVVDTLSSPDLDTNQICIKEKATNMRDISSMVHDEMAELVEEQTQVACQVVDMITNGEKNTGDHQLEVHIPTAERCFDPSLDSVQNNASYPVPDLAISNPYDASTAGINLVLEKNQGDTQKEKSNAFIPSIESTEDDDKSHMDLTASILERSRRLKSLILKRRARKCPRAQAEMNFQRLDVNKGVLIMDELSDMQLQIPPISTGRQDLYVHPSYPEDSIIPGSAPSFFLPRGSILDEFDFPYDQEDEDSDLVEVSLGHPGSSSLPTKDLLFRKYESFSLGTSLHAEPGQEKHDSRLRSDFIIGRSNLEQAGCSHSWRQKNGKSFSKLTSIPGSRSNSSAADVEYSELLEQELNKVRCSECDAKHLVKEDNHSHDIYLSQSPNKEGDIDTCGIHDVDFGTFNVAEEGSHETFDDFVEYEMKVRHQMGFHSPTSYSANSDKLN